MMNRGQLQRQKELWSRRSAEPPFFPLILLTVSCSWYVTREFRLPGHRESAEIDGWTFQPRISAFRGRVVEEVPKYNRDRFALEIIGYHEGAELNKTDCGVDIDMVALTMVETGQRMAFRKFGSSMSADSKTFENWFSFADSTGSGLVLIPPEIDTVRLEFDIRYYRGVHRQFRLPQQAPEKPVMFDSIAVDTVNPETFRRHIVLETNRKESKKLGPGI